MKKELKYSGNMCYIYLTKTIIQLLQVIPEKHSFLFTIKNKTLYITKIDNDKLKTLENPYVQKIRTAGSGYGIFFTKSMLELLDLNPDQDKIDIEIEEQTLIIKKAGL